LVPFKFMTWHSRSQLMLSQWLLVTCTLLPPRCAVMDEGVFNCTTKIGERWAAVRQRSRGTNTIALTLPYRPLVSKLRIPTRLKKVQQQLGPAARVVVGWSTERRLQSYLHVQWPQGDAVTNTDGHEGRQGEGLPTGRASTLEAQGVVPSSPLPRAHNACIQQAKWDSGVAWQATPRRHT
jgi:hypothetical protein